VEDFVIQAVTDLCNKAKSKQSDYLLLSRKKDSTTSIRENYLMLADMVDMSACSEISQIKSVLDTVK
jgi:hypothetical protein